MGEQIHIEIDVSNDYNTSQNLQMWNLANYQKIYCNFSYAKRK